jgi:REP element-mobilizing transposase RayT
MAFTALVARGWISAPKGHWCVATGKRQRSPWKAVIELDCPGGAAVREPVHCDQQCDMPGTYSQLLLHIVFSTKGREPWISAEIADRLYQYIGGIVRSEKGVLLDIGVVDDHLHVYVRWRTDASVSDLMRVVKGSSSKWIHETFPALSRFAWQEGYSVFSVSKSQEPVLRKYIASQAEHHAAHDFKAELLGLLLAHGVEFEERWVFD